MAGKTWYKYKDSASEKEYYYNVETKTTQWNEPTGINVEIIDKSNAAAAASSVEGSCGASESTRHHLFMIKQIEKKTRKRNNAAVDDEALKNAERLSKVLEAAPIKPSNDSVAVSKWKKYWSDSHNAHYYHNIDTDTTTWEAPTECHSSTFDWLPSSTTQKEEEEESYQVVGKFNSMSGKFDKSGGEDYWIRTGKSADRAGRQLSTYFDQDTLNSNREEAKKKRQKLCRDKKIDWKKYEAQKKARNKQKRDAWMFENV